MGRVAFREGGNHPAGRPVADVTRFTPGKYVPLAQSPLRGDGVRMCTADGEKAQFIFNDSVDVADDMGVGLITRYSGGDAIRVLAGGAVAADAEVVVKISATDSLPKFIEAGDGAAGDWICGRVNFGNSSTAEDLADANGDYDPSLTIFLYDEGVMRQVGTESVEQTVQFPVTLATVGNGDVVTEWTPGFAGTITGFEFIVGVPVTTADKTATFNLEINAVDVTGGVLVVTSALATPLGKVIAATAITALNVFDDNDTISIEASAVTAFVEGTGTLVIKYTTPTAQA